MYSYETYAKVKEELAKRRQQAISEADRRSEKLRMESDTVRAIDAELSATGVSLFKAACRGQDITPIKNRNLELQEKKKEIIKSLGYPENYTEISYTCKKCSDTGYTENGVMCACFKEALVKTTISASGMGLLLEKQSFANFDLGSYEGKAAETMTRTVTLAKEFADNFTENRGNLLLIGKTGTGKTHISSAIARVVIEKGFDVIYDSSQNIINGFENDRFKSNYGSKDFHSERYLECDLLIIDDLGTEFSTPFTLSCIYNLLNTRQNRGLSTIISTNLSPEELAKKYEDRIYSRIVGVSSRILAFEGKDHRIHR